MVFLLFHGLQANMRDSKAATAHNLARNRGRKACSGIAMTGSYFQARNRGLTPGETEKYPTERTSTWTTSAPKSQNQQRTNNWGLDSGASEIDMYGAAAPSSSAAITPPASVARKSLDAILLDTPAGS